MAQREQNYETAADVIVDVDGKDFEQDRWRDREADAKNESIAEGFRQMRNGGRYETFSN